MSHHSDHISSLDPVDQARYRRVLQILGCECPYLHPKDVWVHDPHEWPYIDQYAIVQYLIDYPGVTTRQVRENFNSVRSSNLLDSGWVQRVLHQKLNTGFFLFKADVTRSYTVNKEAHLPWAAATEDGEIITAHCTCKAGPGETCTHVGALLKKIERTSNMGITKPATCTDKKCTWNSVEWGGVEPARIADIYFYSDNAKSTMTATVEKQASDPASQAQREALTAKLLTLPNLPVGLSLFRSSAENFVSKLPVPLIRRVPKMLKELLPNINKCTEDELLMVEVWWTMRELIQGIGGATN